MPDGIYAPQSPDLSSFRSSTSPQKKPPTSSYAPRSPNISSFPTSVTVQPHHQQQQQQKQQQQQQQHIGLGLHAPSSLQYQPYNNQFTTNLVPAQQVQNQSYLPPIPDLPPSHSFPQHPDQTSFQSQHYPQQPAQTRFLSQPFPPQQDQYRSNLPVDTQLGYQTSLNQPDMSARNKRGAVKGENGTGSGQAQGLGPSQGIEIKTKFPVARIKRIMQADEEVGKVAQVTPVAVSKALELFMIELVTKSATIAKSSNSKRVTAQHLKKVIEGDEQYDFLNEIVGRVAEGPDAGGKRVKSEDGSEDEDMDKVGGGRTAKKAKGRRKKGE